MKFNSTYKLVEYLHKKKKISSIRFDEEMGYISAYLDGELSDDLKKYLESKFSNLANAIMEKYDWEFKLDGYGYLAQTKNKELTLDFSIENEAFPSEFGDSSSNEKFICGLKDCLFSILLDNDQLMNPPEDEDYEYAAECDPIPLHITFTSIKGDIRSCKHRNLDETQIKKIEDPAYIAEILHEYIRLENNGACFFSYNDGDSVYVDFNADEGYLNIYEIDHTELDIKDFLEDNTEYELEELNE